MRERKSKTLNLLYNYPEYYDILFRRDVSSETAFLTAIFDQYCDRPLKSYLDLFCGPGYHARDLSGRGIDAIGLDANADMIAFARDQAMQNQEQVEWRVGDVRDFEIDRPVDLAACLFDSIDGLLSIDDFVRHFQAVAKALKPDGLYVIGKMHPRDTPIFGYGPFHYRKMRDGKEVALDWATDVEVDTLTQTAEVLLKLRVTENGHTQTMHHRTREAFPTPPFLEATARLSEALEPVAWFGDFDLKQPYDDTPSSQHCISIYRRPQGLEFGDGDK